MKRLFFLCTLFVVMTSFSVAHASDPVYLPIIRGDGLQKTAIIRACTLAEMQQMAAWDGKTNATPDPNSDDGCLLPSHSAPLDSLHFGAYAEEVEAASVNDQLIPRKYAKNKLHCTTCTTANGIAKVNMILSAKEPSVVLGGTWTNYWWSNSTTVYNTNTITCQDGTQLVQQIGVGIGKGRLTPSIPLSSPTIYWIVASPGYCYGFTSYWTVAPQSALLMEIYRESDGTGWTARAWLGYWYYIFVHEYTLVNAVQGVTSGQEIGAADNDFTRIRVPMNFVHKLEIIGQGANLSPWYDAHLPTVLKYKSSVATNAPFNVMDLVGGDYTSLTAEIN